MVQLGGWRWFRDTDSHCGHGGHKGDRTDSCDGDGGWTQKRAVVAVTKGREVTAGWTVRPFIRGRVGARPAGS